jgi:hypothetical protein
MILYNKKIQKFQTGKKLNYEEKNAAWAARIRGGLGPEYANYNDEQIRELYDKSPNKLMTKFGEDFVAPELDEFTVTSKTDKELKDEYLARAGKHSAEENLLTKYWSTKKKFQDLGMGALETVGKVASIPQAAGVMNFKSNTLGQGPESFNEFKDAMWNKQETPSNVIDSFGPNNMTDEARFGLDFVMDPMWLMGSGIGKGSGAVANLSSKGLKGAKGTLNKVDDIFKGIKNIPNRPLRNTVKGGIAAAVGAPYGFVGANLLLEEAEKNLINRKLNMPLFHTRFNADPTMTYGDTTINLNNKNLGVGTNKSYPENTTVLLGGDFIDDTNDTVKTAEEWENSTGLYSDKELKVSDIESFYGVENGKFKVGKTGDFNKNTKIVPNRYGTTNINKAEVKDGRLRLTDKENNPIYHNTTERGKAILYSPSSKSSSFISFSSPKKGVEQINNFMNNNKDAQYIVLDNGRFRHYASNPEGLSTKNQQTYYSPNYFSPDEKGYNMVIQKAYGGQLPSRKLGGNLILKYK